MTEKKKRGILLWRILSLTFTFLTCIFIFFNSQDDGTVSQKKSDAITDRVAPYVIKDYEKLESAQKDEKKGQLSWCVRKLAHVTEYFLLGVFSTAASLSFFGERGDSKSATVAAFLGSFLFCAFYAFTDEFHQYFISGRSGQIRDVLIDCMGASLAGLAVWIALCVVKKRKQRNVANISERA